MEPFIQQSFCPKLVQDHNTVVPMLSFEFARMQICNFSSELVFDFFLCFASSSSSSLATLITPGLEYLLASFLALTPQALNLTHNIYFTETHHPSCMYPISNFKSKHNASFPNFSNTSKPQGEGTDALQMKLQNYMFSFTVG